MAVVPAFYLPQGVQPPDRVLYVWQGCVSNEDCRRYVLSGGRPPRVHPKYPHLRTWADDNTFPDALRDHSVVYVTHADAVAFCEWLTRQECSEEVIGPADEYRLPTLEEWRGLAALHAENILHRDIKPSGIYVAQQQDPVAQIDHFHLAVSANDVIPSARASGAGPSR